MKAILSVFFLFFFVFLYCEEALISIENTFIPTKGQIYPLKPNGKFLFFETALKTGKIIPDELWNSYVGLQDSFINDNYYRKDAEGVVYTDTYCLYKDFKKLKDPYSSHIEWIILLYQNSLRTTFKFAHTLYVHRDDVHVNQSEVMGMVKYFWEFGWWNIIEWEFQTQKRPLFLSSTKFLDEIYMPYIPSEQCYKDAIFAGKLFPVDEKYYQTMLQNKKNLDLSDKPYYSGSPHWTKRKIELMTKLLYQSSYKKDEKGYFPIMCIDPNNHAERVDKNDWAIYTFLNRNNGDFYQYFFFEKEAEYEVPLFLRDWALDYLAGVHICKKSTTGVKLNSKEKVTIRSVDHLFNPKKILFALDSTSKPWRPNSLPEDKRSINKNRLYYEERLGRIFGSTCKVWELDIWQRVGYMLKSHPEGIYLVGYGTLLQAEETQTVEEEHAFIQKHGVLITPELYTALEYLRKSQKDTSCPR